MVAIVFIVGVIMAIVGISGGIMITVLGAAAPQGAIIQYAFR